MEEPSLSCGPATDRETYRFTWLRTFHNPITVRVSRRHGAGELIAVVLDGAGGYEPGNVSHAVRRALGPGEWQRIEAGLDPIGFWSLRPTGRVDETGCDGAEWILEGRRAGRHRVETRWSPDDGPYRQFGLTLVEMAGLQMPPDDVY